MLNKLIKELNIQSNKEKAANYQRFFNQSYTDKDDKFIGVTLPIQRQIAKKYTLLSLSQLQKLLESPIHEHRMIAGILLTKKCKKNPTEIFNFYLKNAKKFYNWDLVDITCTHIIGNFILNEKRDILYTLAKSKNLWEKRISIVSNYPLIKNNEFADILKISEILIKDEHDLIHKAIGWMLREVGKRNQEVLLDFLNTNYKNLPRITLRYAIEKFSPEERKKMLKGNFSKLYKQNSLK